MADVYLLLAEAENELNGPSEAAYAYLNAVRERANLPALSTLSQEELRQAIRQERGWELVCEGEGRKFDLIRWGTLIETIGDLPSAEQNAFDNDPSAPAPFQSKSLQEAQTQASLISEKFTVLPIPADEIEKNPNLNQNSLWQ